MLFAPLKVSLLQRLRLERVHGNGKRPEGRGHLPRIFLKGLYRRFILVPPPSSLRGLHQAWFLRLFLRESREIASTSRASVVALTWTIPAVRKGARDTVTTG
jgi:hypothetical protein